MSKSSCEFATAKTQVPGPTRLPYNQRDDYQHWWRKGPKNNDWWNKAHKTGAWLKNLRYPHLTCAHTPKLQPVQAHWITLEQKKPMTGSMLRGHFVQRWGPRNHRCLVKRQVVLSKKLLHCTRTRPPSRQRCWDSSQRNTLYVQTPMINP